MGIYQDLASGKKKFVQWVFVLGTGFVGLFFAVLIFAGAYMVLGLGIQQWRQVVDRGTFQINVSGENSIFLKPDIATFSLTVKTTHAESAEAEKENTARYNKIVELLKSKGVEEKDIRTSNYTINPQYQYDNQPCIRGYCPPTKPPKVIGYEVVASLNSKVRDLKKVGEILKAVVDAGATQIYGQSFGIEDEIKVKEEAKGIAIEKAKENAKKLASKLGVKLVKIVGFSESGGFPTPYMNKELDFASRGGLEEVPDIQVGENEVRMVVTLTYEVK